RFLPKGLKSSSLKETPEMTNPFRKLICTCLAFALSAAYMTTTHAWGPAGHRIVAMIAQQNIKPQTRLRIKQLMGNASIVSVANWADAIREARPETSNFHFVDLPLDR